MGYRPQEIGTHTFLFTLYFDCFMRFDLCCQHACQYSNRHHDNCRNHVALKSEIQGIKGISIRIVDSQCSHKCRYDACAPFARRAMDNDGIIVLVQQNIENPAVFFGVVADELAVHLLHDSVDSIALDFLFLYTFQDILHVAGRNGDMDHFECLLQRALSIRFDR